MIRAVYLTLYEVTKNGHIFLVDVQAIPVTIFVARIRSHTDCERRHLSLLEIVLQGFI
jgi:hypothetical protein